MAFQRRQFIEDAREQGFKDSEINSWLVEKEMEPMTSSEKAGNVASGIINRLPLIMGGVGGAVTGIPTAMAGAPIGAAAGAASGYALRDLLSPYAARKPAGTTPEDKGKYLVDPEKFGTPTGIDWAMEQEEKGGEQAVGEGLMSGAAGGSAGALLATLYGLARPDVWKGKVKDITTRKVGKSGDVSEEDLAKLTEQIKGIEGGLGQKAATSKYADKAASELTKSVQPGSPRTDVLGERRLLSSTYPTSATKPEQIVHQQSQGVLSDYLKQQAPALKITDPAYSALSKYQEHQGKILGGTGGAILTGYLIRKLLNRLGGRENY